jgi:PHD/YefM family antitoxin component YafN of YafNO toxin-antitoxin module
MVATQNTQSLTDFRQRAAETLERINRTGAAEILTVNGEARAVLLAPAVYDELAREAELSRDVEVIQRSLKEIREGKFREADEVFDEIHAKLLRMKKQGKKRTDK